MLLFNAALLLLQVAFAFNSQPLKHRVRRFSNSNPRFSSSLEFSKSHYSHQPQQRGSRYYCPLSSNTNHDATAMSDDTSYLILNLDGFQYKINRNVLLGFPDSYFGKILETEWNESKDAIVDIQRSGELFKFVYDYMFYGKLPRNEIGMSLVGDASLLKKVAEEATFYQLPGLVAECETLLTVCEIEQRVKHYADVYGDIQSVVHSSYFNRFEVVYKPTGPNSLLALLRSIPVVPAWIRGTLPKDCNPKIFKSTTVQHVNVPELLTVARPSPFGRGTETVMDKNVRDSLEIPASKLCKLKKLVQSIDISSLAPKMKLTLKPYKLVIYQEGGHFDSHRDTVRDERHIGTLVLILNSEYTGGELEVSHGEQNLVVTGAFNWVAMYGDCLHKIRPVTSGARVSLIFDIYNESDELSSSTSLEDSNDNDEEENNDYYKYEFWPEYEFDIGFWQSKGSTTKASKVTSTLTRTLSYDNHRIYAALDKELEKYTTVSICLEHLYPQCQANPDFLKGKDANLYHMLKDKYWLGVTSIAIARSSCSWEQEESVGCKEFGSNKLLGERESLGLFVPNVLDSNSIVYYSPEAEFLGNEGRAQEMVYLVAVLVIRKL